MLDHLYKIAVLSGILGEEESSGSAMPKMQEIGTETFQSGQVPNVSGRQGKWSYAIIPPNEKGTRKMQINTGDRVFEWEYADREQPSHEDSRALPVSFLRKPDKDKDGFAAGAEAKGVLQVHRAGPSEIHATLQDGRRNLTFNFVHTSGDRWVMVPKAQRNRAADTGNFAKKVEQVATAPSPVNPETHIPESTNLNPR